MVDGPSPILSTTDSNTLCYSMLDDIHVANRESVARLRRRVCLLHLGSEGFAQFT